VRGKEQNSAEEAAKPFKVWHGNGLRGGDGATPLQSAGLPHSSAFCSLFMG